ncbi:MULTISPECIES: transferrin receptor-like dimerization domain-containing protein [unclassified Sphingomonas]|uniref:transferrin receptor-like dimerization domain-containing protein n=1 Tax=unclassified Sphingomonas TaxID=196159 RepID=UPI0009267020|nr:MULTISPECIES: transferrin receptor-like dimerization domain-containing protein [unclassified Sphingomonas]MBN8847423.1 M28 family peptidase [Sphingomonas sp.]OJV32339.1 MAG: folate hydrolase [Sphingomonas sp. 67-36]
MRAAGILAGAALAAMAAAGVAQTAPTDRKAIEARFDQHISSADQLAWLKDMSSAPNHVGSPHDKANAEAILARFRQWGWDAHIETFHVLYPTPISTTVEMVAPEKIVLGGQEPPIPGDDTSSRTADALPPYVAFQGDGDVTGDLVYVNYGMPEDYKDLARRGIDVKGKIVIARYGTGWRGLKPKLAQDHGAIGCIIYSDPADDGYAQSDAYPVGGARPAGSVQRGSVADMPLYPGDPLTPGIGATLNAKRLTREEAPTLLKIPVLPMSYGDAGKLLARLGGPVAPAPWRGALPVTYHMGGNGGVSVHLAVKSNWKLTPAYDVIAMLKGARYPDQWVIRGNHHDGWVFGAADPLSGNVAMLSEAKALGELYRSGWRPARTIVYTSWDAEEPMLLGSTEWAEQHADELKQKGAIYINTDGNGRGMLHAQGSHPFQHLVNAVAADVTDPETGASVAARARAGVLADAFDRTGHVNETALAAAEKGGDLPLGALGSGSDYSAYIQHLGLPALNIGFGGEDESDGVYHSIYDSFHHVTTFDDPGLKYGAALSKVVGRLVLRLADADLPVQRYGDFADTVAAYLGEVKKLAADRRAEDAKRDRLTADGAFRLASDPLKPVGAPAPEAMTPEFDFAALDGAVKTLRQSAAAFDGALAARGAALSQAQRDRLSVQLRDIDQLLLDDRGLPERPWYKHLIYAPGRFTGYGAKTLPGVREAIEERRFGDAREFVGRTAKVLRDYAARLDQARATVEGK